MEASKKQHELIMAGDLSNREIARLTGTSHQRIARIRSSTEGAPPSPAPTSENKLWDRDRGRALVLEGELTNTEIANLLGTNAKSVSFLRQKTEGAPPSPRKYVNQELVNSLIRGRNIGDRSIAAAAGCSVSSVKMYRRALGFEPLPVRTGAEHDEEVARLSAQQVPIKRQARILGITPRQVESSRRRQGLTGVTNQPVSAERRAQANAMFEDGASYAEVHRTTGINTKYLRKHWPDKGWTQEQTMEYRHALRKAREAGIDL